MTVIKLTVSDEGLKELVMFVKTFPVLNLDILTKDGLIIIKYDEKELLKISSGYGKL
jgi:hypothetical protein